MDTTKPSSLKFSGNVLVVDGEMVVATSPITATATQNGDNWELDIALPTKGAYNRHITHRARGPEELTTQLLRVVERAAWEWQLLWPSGQIAVLGKWENSS